MLNQADVRRVLVLAACVGRDLAADPEHESELRRWVGVDRSDGIPAEALPPPPSRTPSPVRDVDVLATAGKSQRPVATFEETPLLAVLATNEDEPEDWLRVRAASRRG